MTTFGGVVLDASLTALLAANGGLADCHENVNQAGVIYKIRFPPAAPLQLQLADGVRLAALAPDLGEMAPDRIVLRGNDNDGGAYKVIIPSTVHLTPRAIDANIRHIGALYVGVPGDLEMQSSLFIF
jgi:hypothetical protein|eukprot:m.428214 g.428214  ORF g.428214 m.428214 type:complete len:127 (+) comp67768_c0_seq1:55-435(+)